MSMIPVINESNAQDAIRNLSDLTLLENSDMDQTCLDLAIGLVAFYRGRQLEHQRTQQEAAWSKHAEAGGIVTILLLMALAAGATVAILAGWLWWAGMAAAGLAMLTYLAILSYGEDSCHN